MNTLLMRLAAPLQSWGIDSKFEVRRTAKEPSKSGIVGLVAAAMGIKRYEDEKIARLASLRVGVRVDREGKIVRDFNTAKSKEHSYVTHRYYLSDAIFIVGIENDDIALLKEIECALNNPVYPLFLGRRSCPPTGKINMGINELPLEDALEGAPLQDDKCKQIRMILDVKKGERGMVIRDMPVSFNPENRQYTFREVYEIIKNIDTSTEHDAMSELE